MTEESISSVTVAAMVKAKVMLWSVHPPIVLD